MTKLDDLERGPVTGRGFQFMPDMVSHGRGIYIHKTAHVETFASLGDNCIVWAMSYVMGGACIGTKCMLGQGVHVGTDVVIGNGCSIQNGAQVFTGVTLEDDVFLGPHCTFTNVLTPRAFQRAPVLKRTLVKRGASIGANATIVCGVTIGEYAMIGAGSVVTKDVQAHALVMGNPTRHQAWVCRCGNKLQQTHFARIDPSGASSARYACTTCTARYLSSDNVMYDVEGPADAPAP